MYIPCYRCSDILFVNLKRERGGIEKSSAKIFKFHFKPER